MWKQSNVWNLKLNKQVNVNNACDTNTYILITVLIWIKKKTVNKMGAGL